MPFVAKPSGGYTISSAEGTNNIYMIYNYLSPLGYTKVCISGMLGNIYAESGLNPWRWQNNTVNYAAGYGLMQFTPASQYIYLNGIPNHAPNLSTTEQTAGAAPDDGLAQLYVFDNDILSKWYSPLWRSYWSSTDYPVAYSIAQNCMLEYGTADRLSMAQFKTIDELTYATMAFLGCYEGPAVPNFDARYAYAQQIYAILEPYGGRDDFLIELKVLDTQQKRKFNNI